MQYASIALCVLLSSAIGTSPHGPRAQSESICWSPDFESALARARQEGKPLFVALNMDGEKANDALAKKVYADASIVALSKHSVNLIGSSFDHAPAGSSCPRFGSLSCAEHRAVEKAIRKQVLGVSTGTPIVAPQHFFLDADSKIILEVPYALELAELQWCFAAALAQQGIESKVELSPKRRAPKRLLMANLPISKSAPKPAVPTREQVELLLLQLKDSKLESEARRNALLSLMRSDEKKALAYVESLLKRPGKQGKAKDPRLRILIDIAAESPSGYWDMLSKLISKGDEQIRNHAIVALEQLGAEKSLKALRKLASKEKNPLLLKNLLRAMACAGPGDRRVRKELIKRALKESDPLLRLNAVIALGHLAPGKDVEQVLRELAAGENSKLRMAAACAMAMTRDPAWIDQLIQLFKAATLVDEKRALASVRLVFEEGDLHSLGQVVRNLGGDRVGRPRFFGRSMAGD